MTGVAVTSSCFSVPGTLTAIEPDVRALTAFGIVFLALPVLNRYWPSAWAWQPEQLTYLHMIWSIYATLGVFLLLAERDPARHLSLIWFTVWSSLAHGTVMAIHAVTDPGQIGKLTGDVLSREAMPI
jgi:hypothetical protein